MKMSVKVKKKQQPLVKQKVHSGPVGPGPMSPASTQKRLSCSWWL